MSRIYRHQVLSLLAMLLCPLVDVYGQQAILLDCPELQESSGVAVSNHDPNLIWTHNDSGGKPRLYLFDRHTGKRRGTFELKGAANIDWEDMCSFRVGDQSFLAIGDIGDNQRQRKLLEICIIKEPEARSTDSDPDDVEKIEKIIKLEVRYPGGAMDCESLAFDPKNSRFILLSKEPFACRLFAVPIDSRLLTDFDDTRYKVDAEYLQGFALSLVTGADICPETRQLVICNYGVGFLAQPSSSKPLLWDSKSLAKVALPKRKQGEAIAFINPRQIVTTSESAPTPSWTTELPSSRPVRQK